MNAREYLAGATRRVSWETFTPPDNPALAFDVLIQFHGKDELESVIKGCTTKVTERLPNGQKQFVSQLSDVKFREFLVSSIQDWRGLTFGKLAALGNFVTPNGAKQDWAAKDVTCEDDNKLVALETAMGFEAFVLERCTSLAAEVERQEAAAKNVSAPTPAATTSS